MNRVRILIVAIVALASGLFLAPSSQAAPSDNPYPPSECSTLNISGTNVHVGDTVHISGVGFIEGDELDIIVHSDPIVIAHVTVDVSGAFAIDWVVPDLAEGSHLITVEGSTNDVCPIDPLEIVINGVGPTEPGNANTGVDSLTWILVSVMLLGAGALLATAGRRRNHGRHHGA